jgi:hypothetical protein
MQLDLAPTQKVGAATGEFLGHLVEVAEGRKSLAWLRTKWTPDVSRKIAVANIALWGLK